MLTPEKLMQTGPAKQLDRILLKVEIGGQYGLDIALVLIVFHRTIQLHNTTEFVAASVVGISQNELRVVFRGHGLNLRAYVRPICEPDHKILCSVAVFVET